MRWEAPIVGLLGEMVDAEELGTLDSLMEVGGKLTGFQLRICRFNLNGDPA